MGTGEWEMLSQEEIDALLRSLAEEGSPAGGPAGSGAETTAGGASGDEAPDRPETGPVAEAPPATEPSGGAEGDGGPGAPGGGSPGAPGTGKPAAPGTGSGRTGHGGGGGGSPRGMPAGGAGSAGGGAPGGILATGSVPAAAAAEPAIAGYPGAAGQPAAVPAAGFYPLHGGPEEGEGSTPEAEGPEAVPGMARGTLDLLLDVPLQLTVELGQTQRTVRDLLEMAPGTVVELDRLAGEPVDLLVNGRLIARGEVVVIDENFGIRITDIVSPGERLRRLR